MTSVARSIVRRDLRAIRRDQVAVGTVSLSVLGAAAVAVLGAFRHGAPGWAAWFPFMLAMSLVGGPGGFGLPFGLLMVDEGDTGVRDALAVSPVPPAVFVSLRTAVATGWMAVWPLASIYIMNSTWQAVDLPFRHWLAVTSPLALLTPAFALIVPTFARDKVSALAVFKGLSFLSLAPLALFFLDDGSWLRGPLLVSPTAWPVEALRAFLRGAPTAGYRWAVGGMVFGAILIAVTVWEFRRRVYGLHR